MEQFEIKEVKAREILDGGGYPTIEVDVLTKGGAFGRTAVPSGLSVGKHEAIKIRDEDDRYGGMGVLNAVKNVNEIIAPELKGRDVTKQREIDEFLIELDGTENKSKLGANSILGVSLSIAKAASECIGIPLYKYIGGINSYILPVPLCVVIHGGRFFGGCDFEDASIIIPVGAETFSEAMRINTEVCHKLSDILKKKYGNRAVIEGAPFVPPIKDVREALDITLKAIEELGYGDKFGLGIDAAANNFYDEKKEKYIVMENQVSREDMIEFYKELISTYPILMIEDPLHEEDFEGFAEITTELDIEIVGDDIFATNIKRLRRGIEIGAANTLLLKVDQIGTISEALDAAELAFRNGYGVLISGRSLETEDTVIADIAVGLNCGQIKTGGTYRNEVNVKHNRLLRIEEELGRLARYPKNFRKPL